VGVTLDEAVPASPAPVGISHLNDVHGVTFAGEAECVLFIPGSGDVLLCDALLWEDVCAEAAGLLPPEPDGLGSEVPPTAELRAMLNRLGAQL
jgi:hypothetical protein